MKRAASFPQRKKSPADNPSEICIRIDGPQPATRSVPLDRFQGRSIGEICGEFLLEQGRFNANEAGQKPKAGFRVFIPREALLAGCLERTLATRATLSSSGLTSIEDVMPHTVITPDRRKLWMLDLLSRGSINSNSVRFPQENSFTNAAAGTGEGEEKPEATLDLTEAETSAKKIAVWTKATMEILEDFDGVRSYIDSTLAFMVLEELDNQILNGDGTSNTLVGIFDTAGIQTVNATAFGLVHDAVDKGAELIRTNANREPNGYVIHPSDWGNLRRTKDANGQAYGGNAFGYHYGVEMPRQPTDTLWGLPIARTTAIPQGTILAGDFSGGATLFIRSGLAISFSDSDDDNFTKNLVTVKAEMRALLAVWKPLCFCEITNIPAV